MRNHLLLISIGPIQDFIASARRCQDLWFGSWLLSDLARATASAVQTAAGSDALIFPGSLEVTPEGKPAVANKILCIVPAVRNPIDVATAGRHGLDEERNAVTKAAFDRISSEGFHREKAEAQVQDLIEYIWVSVPIQDINDAGYSAARRRAEQLLAARKNTKVWLSTQKWAGSVPKSALDGWRESVLDEKLYEKVRKGEQTAEWLRSNYFVKKSERLCGIGLLKRVGSESDQKQTSDGRLHPVFHSTSHVASAPFRTHVAQLGPKGTEAIANYFQALRNLNVNLDHAGLRVQGSPRQETRVNSPLHQVEEAKIQPTPFAFQPGGVDGRMFYDSRIEELLEEYRVGETTPEILKQAQESLRACLTILGARPTAYYAVLQADGDNMGHLLDKVGEVRGIRGHKDVARALDAFSIKSRFIVESHSGSLLYAGGDDVLALLPLHTAFGCARQLKCVFVENLQPFAPESGQKPTLSVGLGIAHHLDEMADARGLAKAAESAAKGHPGKNALAIIVQKRGGGRLTTVGSWDESVAGKDDVAWRIDEYARAFHEGRLPDKVAFDLEQAAVLLVSAPGGDLSSADRAKLVASQARRVFGRKMAQGGSIVADMGFLQKRLAETESAQGAVGNLSQELQIARVFLEAYQVAFQSLDSIAGTTPEDRKEVAV